MFWTLYVLHTTSSTMPAVVTTSMTASRPLPATMAAIKGAVTQFVFNSPVEPTLTNPFHASYDRYLAVEIMGSSLDINPPNADRHITAGGSDWLWAVFAIMLISDIVMVFWTFSVSLCSGHGCRRMYQLMLVACRDRAERVCSTRSLSPSSPRLLSRTSRWPQISAQPPSLRSSLVETPDHVRFG